MPTRPEDRPTLGEIQAAFGRSLHVTANPAEERPELPEIFQSTGEVHATDRLAVYRNNTRQFFRNALALTYPVLRKRVGDEFFRQLAHEYRLAHPSRHGDLHWVGQAFPAWLEVRLAGSEYAWLAQLAQLEWACEEAAVAAHDEPIDLARLADVPAHSLEHLTLRFQPSLRLVRSTFPLWSVWQANQGDDAGSAVDLLRGGECCVVACGEDRVAVYRLEDTDFALLEFLANGNPLGAAVTAAGADAVVLRRLLAWVFAEQLVVGLS